ncbi:hypothetical protein FY557_16480 [Chryseobacterium sp. SN22]|uniref:hypothetical protein n=1 Tax=Chryseobacterium sp. SN22 TaxID=2606431 RepID=UPI0011ECB9F0|nr:hypothetical protein [Chryseobacterium sp. SN22]KAA0126634.1 hypothetical protein FY557_16480 [Chryseobacterium sp. SN22]
MKTYLAVLRTDADLIKLGQELKRKKIRLTAHYKAVSVIKLQSRKAVSAEDFTEYFLSVEEDRNNFTI